MEIIFPSSDRYETFGRWLIHYCKGLWYKMFLKLQLIGGWGSNILRFHSSFHFTELWQILIKIFITIYIEINWYFELIILHRLAQCVYLFFLYKLYHHHHLSFEFLVEHRASVKARHSTRSLGSRFNSSQLFPVIPASSNMLRLHVRLSLPRCRLPWFFFCVFNKSVINI